MNSFEENLALLKKTNPRLAQLVDETKCSKTSWVKTALFEDNLLVKDQGGTFYLHSQEGAKLEAARWFSSLHTTGLWTLFVIGFGLGYLYDAALSWLEKNPGTYLVIIEHDLEIFRRFLELESARKILENSRVKFIYIGDEEASKEPIPHYLFRGSIEISTLPSYQARYSLRSKEITQLLKHHMTLSALVSEEYLNYGAGFFSNFYPNLLALPRSFLATSLFGKFKGVPAIIAGAGPSLEKNVSILKTLGDKALVFAGGSAMNVVSSTGFLPHFGIGIDPNRAQSYRIATNQAFMTPYFYRGRMNREALGLVHGDHLYVPGSGGYKTASWFEKELGIQEVPLMEGSNVANFSLSLAHLLGCNPIIFVGLDLSFSESASYAKGIVRCPLVLCAESVSTKSQQDELLVTKDIYGQPVLTLWKWINEATFYSNFQKRHPELHLVNATEGGIGFAGIENLSLEEVKSKFLKKNYPLRVQVHEAIQNAMMPVDVTHDKIVFLLKELDASLERLSTKEAFDETAQLEIGFEHLLSDFDAFYSRWKGEEEDIGRDSYLLKVIQANRLLIARALSNQPVEEKTGGAPHQGELFWKSGGVYLEKEHYYYPKGELRAKIPRNLHGTVELYYPNGKLKRSIPFYKGKRDGVEEWHFPDGTLEARMQWKKDLPILEAVRYYRTGALRERALYTEEGEFLSGEEFLPDGRRLQGEKKDFFSDASEKTLELHKALGKTVVEATAFLAPLKKTGQYKEDFEELEREITRMASLEQDLKQQGETSELWKGPIAKRMISEKIEEATGQMQEALSSLRDLLKKLKEKR